ncbi:MAG: N-6 DNA methylase [Candidatus Marsarchaeota archaeon]|nr:N-6 DNA methylase [Candidatus Marsarchaeota archaeon]
MMEANLIESHKRLRKTLGAYYTPEVLALALAKWAVRCPKDRILDPSFGGCAFLHAGQEALADAGAQHPEKLVFGVDVHPEAASFGRLILEQGARKEQFLVTDFLTVTPESTGMGSFDIVLGNPPYVRHHLLKGRTRESAEYAAQRAGIRVGGRASYWAYFVAHCLGFLAPEGRLALLLPTAFMYAEYADELRREIVRKFRSTAIILLCERVFADVQERTVVLLAEGYGSGPGEARIVTARSVEALHQMLGSPRPAGKPLNGDGICRNWLYHTMTERARALYQELTASPQVTTLGDLCSIRIGTVTGANDFFVLSSQAQKQHEIPHSCLKPILTRSSLLRGLTFAEQDWRALIAESTTPALVLDTNSLGVLPESVERYLSRGVSAGIPERYKCRTRTPWHSVPVSPPPDAFLQYMSARRPRLVLNQTSLTCTNAIHVANWHDSVSEPLPSSVATSIISSLTQLSSELVGRSYGGGVLKLEPNEARQLVIALPSNGNSDACDKSAEVDSLLRDGKSEQASQLVDDWILRQHLGLSKKDVQCLRANIALLQRLRIDKHTVSNHPGISAGS